MEQSFYNAYIGAMNTKRKTAESVHQRAQTETIVDTYLPMDSYSPLRAQKRGLEVGGFQKLTDESYYGCCACIASAGVGVFMKSMVTVGSEGITVNFFEDGVATVQYQGATVQIRQKTAYPLEGKVEITVTADVAMTFTLRVWIPGWSGSSGYALYERAWYRDRVCVDYPMQLRTQRPNTWEQDLVYTTMAKTVYHDPDDDHYIALMRGPLTLAADSRTGRPSNSVFDFAPSGALCEDRKITEDDPCILKMQFTDRNGQAFYLVDYASAGKDWQTEIAAWLRTK